ncbi:MAG: hypothetical protein H0W15_04425 [Gemmatimonadales bacterium]|nr:hypothetical protein [Gemmatimonadales bacterium]
MSGSYFRLSADFWASALPAADLVAEAVLPSRSAFDAAVAAVAEVFLLVFRCASADPAADFDVFAVSELLRVFEAFEAAAFEVFFVGGMMGVSG